MVITRADYAGAMVTEKTAMIRHKGGSTTPLHVAGMSSVFGLDVTDRWIITPPAGFAPQPGDELMTNLSEGSYEWATPIGDVLPGLHTGS